jgi:hypothetical protein
MDDTKAIYKSKLGLLGFGVAALGIVQALQLIDWAKLFATHPAWAGVITAALGGIVVILRLYTSQPASVTGK